MGTTLYYFGGTTQRVTSKVETQGRPERVRPRWHRRPQTLRANTVSGTLPLAQWLACNYYSRAPGSAQSSGASPFCSISLPWSRSRSRRGLPETRRHQGQASSACCKSVVACATFEAVPNSKSERAAEGPAEPRAVPAKGAVPIYVMLPLDSVSIANTLNHTRALNAGLRALKSIGVEGVMIDVWWGIVEGSHPRVYDWSAYMQLFQSVKRAGLKLQCVMSFHACGGNVGDHCLVSLPTWVLEVAEQNPDVLFTDREGLRNSEYLSFGVDNLPLFQGRTPLQIYRDFMRSFRDTFRSELGDTITEIMVGMGPAGELRYPSYPQGDKRWKFPGIGEFQCYDKYTLSCLAACAEAWNHPEWGNGGPHNAGSYKQWPNETGFFAEHGSWESDYGHFFLSWYSHLLCEHAEHVCTIANSVFKRCNVQLSAKIPGVHWWYQSRSHAAELTAGYYNTCNRNGYDDVISTLKVHNFNLNFTCVEMSDCEQPPSAKCSPERLLAQVRRDTSVSNAVMRR